VLLGVLLGVLVLEGVLDADKVIQFVKAACTAPPEFIPKKYVVNPSGPIPDHPKYPPPEIATQLEFLTISPISG
jgi:hypothetical protein